MNGCGKRHEDRVPNRSRRRGIVLPRLQSYPQHERTLQLTAMGLKRSNVRLFPTKAHHETHFSTVGGSPQAYPRLSQQDEDRRRAQGAARTSRQGPRPACGLALAAKASPAIGSLRAQRLSGSKAFGRLFRDGRRITGQHVQIIAAASAPGAGRHGFIIAKVHLKRAVDRNYVRRIVREALRGRRRVAADFDIIVKLRAACARNRLRELAEETAALIDALAAPKVR
jgi:ribonuclease P protein component